MEAADSAEFVGFRAQTPAIQRLVRIVAALPLHQFMPLNDAFVRAKNCLGAGGIAAHDLTQRARNRRLTIAARRILPDGTEQVFFFRTRFWQYFAIETTHPSPDVRLEVAIVRRQGLIWPAALGSGRWYFFVGRRRFDRCYSTAVPSRPALQKPPREQPRLDSKLTLLPEEPQLEPAPKWRPEEAMKWLAEKMASDPPKPGDKNAWAQRYYPIMQEDFGRDIPWSSDFAPAYAGVGKINFHPRQR